MNYRVFNPQHIKRLLETYPNSIKELVVEVKNTDLFMDDLLDQIIKEESDWPLAVDPSLIVDTNNKSECEIRAINVVDMIIETDLYGLNVLDFGCGDGMIASEMLNRGAKQVTGYDLKSHSSWQEEPGLILTTDKQSIIKNGPYDFILLYDVLDHIVDQEPVIILAEIKELLTKDGIITIRNHPWVAKHGTHLYTQLNRAFSHIIFNETQLSNKGFTSVPTRKILHPVMVYNQWYKKSGLEVIKEDKIMEPIENYFTQNELLMSLIQNHYNKSSLEEYRKGKGDLSKVLSYHFVDYILKKFN